MYSYGIPIDTGALTYSVQKHQVTELLLELGAPINQINNEGFTALHMCGLLNPRYNTVKLLLENGAIIDCTTDENDTPLHFACGSVKTFKLKDISEFYKEIVYDDWNKIEPTVDLLDGQLIMNNTFEEGWIQPNIPISFEIEDRINRIWSKF